METPTLQAVRELAHAYHHNPDASPLAEFPAGVYGKMVDDHVAWLQAVPADAPYHERVLVAAALAYLAAYAVDRRYDVGPVEPLARVVDDAFRDAQEAARADTSLLDVAASVRLDATALYPRGALALYHRGALALLLAAARRLELGYPTPHNLLDRMVPHLAALAD